MSLSIEKIKKQLMTKRESLASELRSVTTRLVDQQFFHTDPIDQASADSDRSFILQMQDRDRALLLQIDETLKKIQEGSFGECRKCGEMISEARLRVFPLASLCIECQAEQEVEGQRFLSREERPVHSLLG